MGTGVQDETFEFIAELNESCTGLIKDIHIKMSNHNHVDAAKCLKRFILRIGMRGILTMAGFRKTTGSQDIPWPSPKLLLDSFNKPNIVMSLEEIQRCKANGKGYSTLTVGGRAWCKHSHRSSDGWWGYATGTEVEKNEHANQKC